jgi:hypothetical protein
MYNDLNESIRKLKLDFEGFALATDRRISVPASIYNELVPRASFI